MTQTHDAIVLWIDHAVDPKTGKWVAWCQSWPAWRYRSDEKDLVGAERSLKSWRTRHVRFEHVVQWDGQT